MYNSKIPKSMTIKIQVDNVHDKIFKTVLSNAEEISKLLKKYIGLEEIETKELEICKNEFITRNYKTRNADIIYKDKEKEIYYLIEHQSTVDKRMPERILTYCVEIIRESQRKEKRETNAVVVPIVIYTGEKNWTVTTEFSNTQDVEEKYKEYKISLKYKLIDINKIEENELKEESKLSIIMLLEKQRKVSQIKNILIEMLTRIKDKELQKWLEEIIEQVVIKKLNEEDSKEVEEILEKLGGESEMDEWMDRVLRNEEREKRKILKKGKISNMIETVKKMLKNQETDEKIMLYTEVTEKELKKIKKELQI